MYVPIVVVVVLAVWWLFIRPIGIARREQQEKQLRERQQTQTLEQKKRALEEMETFHWKETSMGGEMIVSRDVHFPSMRMRLEIRSRYGDSSDDFEIRRKHDGTWEQRLTQEQQLAVIGWLKKLREKGAHYEQLPEDKKLEASNPYDGVETHGLLDDEGEEWSLAAIDRVIDRLRKNEWRQIRELGPQIEFHYDKLLRSYSAQGSSVAG